MKKFVNKHQAKPTSGDRCVFVNTFSAKDQRFLQELSDDLHLHTTWDETDDYGQPIVAMTFNLEGVSEDGTAEEEEQDGEWQSEDEAEDEGDVAIQRVFAKYAKAKVVENTVENFEEHYEETMKEKLEEWKRGYYKVRRDLSPQRGTADVRANSRSTSTSRRSCARSCSDTSRGCSGS